MKHNYDKNYTLDQVMNLVVETLEQDKNQDSTINNIVESYPQYSNDIKEFYATWQGMAEISVPELRPEMDAQFYKMLNEIPKVSRPTNNVWSTITKWVSDPKMWTILAALLIGLTVGRMTSTTSGTPKKEKINIQPDASIIYASNKMKSSAFERLEEIRKSRELDQPNMAILDALNKALLYDSNVNVRLSALETLIIFADHPNVREYLIKSIPFQDSPIVLMELAELMSALQEKQSVGAWQEVLDSDQTESDVKYQLEEKLTGIL